jgi:CheY-like chemotaxis protein
MASKTEAKPLEQIKAENKDLTGTILIVDDNEDILEIIKTTLALYTNFRIITASNGKEALQALVDHTVDVIILDDHMPEMSGAEFFRIIRQRSIYVPVIFLTGIANEEGRKQQMSLGAFDYLEKPVKAKDLLVLVVEASKVTERIRAILERRA